jgi:hypothetical protein
LFTAVPPIVYVTVSWKLTSPARVNVNVPVAGPISDALRVGGVQGDDRRRLVGDRHGVARSGPDVVVGSVLERQDDGLRAFDERVVVRGDRAGDGRLAAGNVTFVVMKS